MLDHLGIYTTRFPQSRRFYDAVMRALGGEEKYQVPMEHTGGLHVIGYGRDRAVFWLQETKDKTTGGIHICFAAQSRAEVDSFHVAALAAGGQDNGAPGLRPHYHPDYYGAFVLDPDGNNVEACYQLRV